MKKIVCDICQREANYAEFRIPVLLHVYGGKGNVKIMHGIGVAMQEVNLCDYHQQRYANFHDSLLKEADLNECTK